MQSWTLNDLKISNLSRIWKLFLKWHENRPIIADVIDQVTSTYLQNELGLSLPLPKRATEDKCWRELESLKLDGNKSEVTSSSSLLIKTKISLSFEDKRLENLLLCGIVINQRENIVKRMLGRLQIEFAWWSFTLLNQVVFNCNISFWVA